MALRIEKKALLQYMFLLVMLYSHGSFLLIQCLGQYRVYFIFGVGLVALLLSKRSYMSRCINFSVIMLVFTVFVRIFSEGGVGLQDWMGHVSLVFIMYGAYAIDADKFVERWIKLITLYAIISIIMFTLSVIDSSLIKSILGTPYLARVTENEWITREYHAWGKLFYVYAEYESSRNLGVFTEPGLYQMVLVSATILLLFFEDSVSFGAKNKKRIFYILSFAILSCQSTTGFIAFGVTMIAYLYIKRNADYKMISKKEIYLYVMFITIFLLFDFYKLGDNSLISKVILSKLYNETGFSLNVDTGAYRMITIGIALKSIIEHPFGIGFAEVTTLMLQKGGVGAAIIQYLAAMGILPFVYVIYFIFKPLWTSKKSIAVVLFVTIIYFNTALAQSQIFYPALIMLPVLFSEREGVLNHDNSNDV